MGRASYQHDLLSEIWRLVRSYRAPIAYLHIFMFILKIIKVYLYIDTWNLNEGKPTIQQQCQFFQQRFGFLASPYERNCYLLEGACRIPKHQPRPPNTGTTNYNLQPHVFPVFGDKHINPIILGGFFYSMERIEGGMSLSETELTDSRNPASPSPWVALWVSGAPRVWMDMDAKITQSPGGHFKGNVNVYISISFFGGFNIVV